MSKKEKIKKYLDEHGMEIIGGVAGTVFSTVAAVTLGVVSYRLGVYETMEEFAKDLNEASKACGRSYEYEVVKGTFHGFNIARKD